MKEKIVEKLCKVQLVYLKVLESPGGKLMDCLLQLCGQLYKHAVSDQIIQNDIACMESQQSRAVFNPSLSLTL